MNYTWADIQLLAIQKMFLNNGAITADDLETMRTDRKYATYLNAMPAIANEGLIRLMSVGTPLIKKYTITHNIPDKIYTYKSYDSVTIIDEDYIIDAGKAKAYYLELNDTCNVEIQKKINDVWETIDVIEHVSTSSYGYEVEKNLIDNNENADIRFVFKAEGFLYEVRNIAFYAISFRLEDDIYDFTPRIKYDLTELIPDFYQIISVEFEKPGTKAVLDKHYWVEGTKTLVIDREFQGTFVITYKAYPDKITEDTDDSYKFTMPAEMVCLLPLFIASELYKDDDVTVATLYRNQFEASLSTIRPAQQIVEFVDTSGWL